MFFLKFFPAIIPDPQVKQETPRHPAAKEPHASAMFAAYFLCQHQVKAEKNERNQRASRMDRPTGTFPTVERSHGSRGFHEEQTTGCTWPPCTNKSSGGPSSTFQNISHQKSLDSESQPNLVDSLLSPDEAQVPHQSSTINTAGSKNTLAHT